MIFVTVGNSFGDFKRLFIEIDRLVLAGLINNVVAQIGNTKYIPQHYTYKHYISKSEFYSYVKQADFIISHAGDGTLEECLGFKKKVIVVPRLAKYKEGRENHQVEIAQFLSDLDRVLLVYEIEDLIKKINYLKNWKPKFKEYDNEQILMDTINDFIKKTLSEKSRLIT